MNEKLNIQDLADLLAKRSGLTKKEAEAFIREFFALIEQGLEQDRYVKIKGWGTFRLISVNSRESINVNTGERFEIGGHTKVAFTPEQGLKDLINKPFAHFETVVLNEGVLLDDVPEVDASDEENASESEDAEDNLQDIPQEPVSEPAPIPQEAVSEQPETSSVPDTPQPEKPKFGHHKALTIIFIAAILLCAGAVALLYHPWTDGGEKQAPRSEMRPERKPMADTLPVPADTLIQADSIPAVPHPQTSDAEQPRQPQPSPQVRVRKPAAQPVRPDSVSYRIVGTDTTYTLKEGETLVRVAVRFWGTKALWPYLVMHNPEVVKDPNTVPTGTTLRIPKLVKRP